MHPKNSGSHYYNYKGLFSIALLGIVDYGYRFLYVDVGCQGRISDGGVYRNFTFYKALENGSLNLPDPVALPGADDPQWMFDQYNEPIPYVLVADNAFPLGRHCMKPFPQSNLSDRKKNFQLEIIQNETSKRKCIWVWGNTFHVFTTTMALEQEKTVVITLATVVLHNMSRMDSNESYTFDGLLDAEGDDGNVIRGEWRSDASNFTKSLSMNKSNRASVSAERIRNIFADYFYGVGQIPWQWNFLV